MLLKKIDNFIVLKRFRSFNAFSLKTDDFLSCASEVWKTAVPYKLMPGPKPWPILGNNWRFIPYIGMLDKFTKTPRGAID